VLKIDRSFISQLTSQRKSLAIVRAAVELARGLGLEVVAEGVEDKETLSLVTEAGCVLVQGYLFARPMPPAELDEWLRRFRG